jgi:hypothetical protein
MDIKERIWKNAIAYIIKRNTYTFANVRNYSRTIKSGGRTRGKNIMATNLDGSEFPANSMRMGIILKW